MKKKVFIPIFIIIFFTLLFAGTQVYLSKQPFRYYYHGILLPVSPGKRAVIEERLIELGKDCILTSADLSDYVEETKKNGRCIIIMDDEINVCFLLSSNGHLRMGVGGSMWTQCAPLDGQAYRELMEYLGWWKKFVQWKYETPNGIPQSVQFFLFLAVEVIGGVILFRKKLFKNKLTRNLVKGCTAVVMAAALCGMIYGRLYFFPVYHELKVWDSPREEKVIVKEYFFLYGWKMRQYYVEVFPGILRKASQSYDTAISWMSFEEGDYIARWEEEEQRIRIALKEKGSDRYDYFEYVIYP